MIKQISVFSRVPGMTREAFRAHWQNRHAPIVCALPGLAAYVQNHAIADDSPFDGVAEVWFPDIDAMRANAGTAELARIRDDEANFIDPASMATIITDDVPVIDGPKPAGPKLVGLINRVAGMDVDTFRRTWRGQLGAVLQEVEGIARYTQSTTRPGIYLTGRTPAFDGEACLWFASDAIRDTALTSPAMARAGQLEQTFIDFARSKIAWVEEITIL